MEILTVILMLVVAFAAGWTCHALKAALDFDGKRSFERSRYFADDDEDLEDEILRGWS